MSTGGWIAMRFVWVVCGGWIAMGLQISQWWLDSHKTCKGKCGGWIAMRFVWVVCGGWIATRLVT